MKTRNFILPTAILNVVVLCGTHPQAHSQTVSSTPPSQAHAEAVTPIERELAVAQAYFDLGRYGLAFDRYEKVLTIQPGHSLAREGEARICEALEKQDYEGWWVDLFSNSIEGTPLRQKLQAIVLPNVDFEQASPEEAIESLRREVQRLASVDPATKGSGMNLVLDPPLRPLAISAPDQSESAPVEPIPGIPAEAQTTSVTGAFVTKFPIRITLHLKQVPLNEAMRYVASQAGMRVLWRADGLHLTKNLFVWDNAPTRKFDLTPEVIGMQTSRDSVPKSDFIDDVIIRRQNAQSWLEANGIQFPPGTSVRYEPETRRLVVRNFPEETEGIAILLGL